MADTNLLVLAREYKKLREEVKKVLSMPKGDKGDRGEKGEKGDKGDTGPQGFPGRDGKDGINGFNGKDGRDGIDGKDGKDGLDGVGVKNAYIDFDNSLVIVLTDGNEINAGYLSQETKDSVIANFKQGAQTLNELLPSQAGNANKFLKTDGTNVSWDTLDGSDINLSSPPVIGNTTPNAATFTTLTATGVSVQSSSANNGLTMVRNTDSSVNSTRLFMDSSGGTATIYNSSGSILFNTNAVVGTTSGLNQFRITHTASAVNYVQVTGAATGSPPAITVQGSDSNIRMNISSKGSESVDILTNNTGTRAARFTFTASSVNWVQMTGSVAGAAPSYSVAGSDTNIGLNLTTKGTGAVSLNTGGGEQLRIADEPSAGRYIQVQGGQPGITGASVGVQGGAGSFDLYANGGNPIRLSTNARNSLLQLQVSHTASAVNYVQVTGAATGGAPTISAQGSDSASSLIITSKGGGDAFFRTGSTGGFIRLQPNAADGFQVSGVASGVNYLRATNSIATAAPILSAQGSDTNIDLALTPKGTGNVRFGTHTTLGSEVITGYITIKDSGGTLRKLAVIS